MAETKDNLAFWKRVQETDPKYTSHVGTRGGFTAIAAQYQLKLATEQWGPYGAEWGVRNQTWTLMEVDGDSPEVVLDAEFFSPLGAFNLSVDMIYKAGNDTRKKMLTDLRSKALSFLGFNADVFMGRFDDSKYVAEAKKKHTATEHASGAQISKIQNLSAKLKGSQAADYVRVILGRRGLKSINELTPKQATDWIKTLENSLMEPIEGDGNEGTQ